MEAIRKCVCILSLYLILTPFILCRLTDVILKYSFSIHFICNSLIYYTKSFNFSCPSLYSSQKFLLSATAMNLSAFQYLCLLFISLAIHTRGKTSTGAKAVLSLEIEFLRITRLISIESKPKKIVLCCLFYLG